MYILSLKNGLIAMDNLKDLKLLISEPRLAAFKGDNDLDKLKAYQRNIELSEALYPALHIFEVCLRNRINELAGNIWGDDWLISGAVQFNSFHTKKIKKAIDDLSRGQKEVTIPRIIAELNLGFWTGLFGKDYYDEFTSKIVVDVFGELPKSTKRRNKIIRFKLRNIRFFRNRIFHYEPIYGEKYPVEQRYNELIELIFWISPQAKIWLEKFCRFNKVINS